MWQGQTEKELVLSFFFLFRTNNLVVFSQARESRRHPSAGVFSFCLLYFVVGCRRLRPPSSPNHHFHRRSNTQHISFFIMSWQDYVDKQLLASGFVNHAAIIGSDGALWAKSASFDVSITRTLCHFIFVWFRFLHFDSSLVSLYGILILLSLCVYNAHQKCFDRRDCFPCRFLFSLIMSFSLSFKTTDWGTRHAAIYGHEFGRIFNRRKS